MSKDVFIQRSKLSAAKQALLEKRSQGNTGTSRLQVIPKRLKQSPAPLSFSQERLWFLYQLEPDSAVYNIPIAIRLEGSLNIPALEQALSEIVRRHEALRTTFSAVEEKPVQVIASAQTLKLPVVNLSELPEAESKLEAQRLATEEVRLPFDLVRGPLLRIKLLCLRPEEHVLILAMHHIISDGWSLGVLFGEITALYKAFSTGQPSPLPELPIQYADFIDWQQQWLQGEVLKSQLDYWKQQLGGSISALELPTARSGPTAETYQGARQTLVLTKNLTAALKALSQQGGVTLFMTLLAAFKTLLYQYTGQSDMLLCSPVAGRNRVETEGLIGYFNNIVVIRTDLSGNPSFRELLGRVRRVALGAYKHQNLPLQKLADFSNLVRTPLTRGMFVLQNTPSHALELPGINVSSLDVHNGTANFDLSLFMEEKAETLKGALEYKTDLFNATTITQMLKHFQTLLESIVANPEQHISSLPLFDKNSDLADSLHTLKQTRQPEETFVAPRDEVELQLTKIWEKVLGIQPVSIRHNFFDLGGHSLLAVPLFTQIEKIIGKNLPLATLFQAPTIEQLADILRQKEWSPAYKSLVPIQPSGTKRPFFCVHGAGGHVLYFYSLAHHLGSDQPFYGLQALGLDGQDFHTQIEDMAAHYIKEMRTVQPEGPYLLGGYCMGGTIALEMAQQLRAQGQETALLVFINTYNWSTIPTTTLSPSKFHYFWQQIEFHWRSLSLLKPKEKLTFLLERAKWGQRRMMTGMMARSSMLTLVSLRNVLEQAAITYVPKVYSGRVTLFQPRLLKKDNATQASWDGVFAAGVDVNELPAYAGGMFVEPFVRSLAKQLRTCLERAESI